MRRVTAVLSAAAFVIATVGVLAQAKTNFAGKWTRDAAPAGAAGGGAPGGAGGGGGRGGFGGGGRGGWGMECTITQDANTLTVEYMGGGQNPAPVKMTYKLDGSESHNSVMGRGGAATDQVSKASWDGANLKIVTTGANGDTTMVVSLAGGKLSIATTAPGRDGTPATNTITYSKS